MTISIISAFTDNFVIGSKGTIPWHLPNDLKHFKKLTLNKTVVMGRKTFESLGKELPNRKNIVVTSKQLKVQTVKSLSDIKEDYFIIGGQRLYEEALKIADVLYITIIHKIINGDTYFPSTFKQCFKMKHIETYFSHELNCFYDFQTWVKCNKS